MPKEFSRTQRIAEAIQHELAQLFQKEIQDPRLKFVSITAVEVSKDLSHAKIYITQLDVKHDVKDTLRALEKAKGYFRRELAHILNLRITPELKFFFDESITRGTHLSALINEVIDKEKKRSE